MRGFEVDSHSISTRQWNGDDGTIESHTVELEGVRHRALLMFDGSLDVKRLGSIVGYASDEDDGAVNIVGWFSLDEFETWKDALEGSVRISVDFELRDGQNTGDRDTANRGYLRRLALRTGPRVIAANTPHGPEHRALPRAAAASTR